MTANKSPGPLLTKHSASFCPRRHTVSPQSTKLLSSRFACHPRTDGLSDTVHTHRPATTWRLGFYCAGVRAVALNEPTKIHCSSCHLPATPLTSRTSAQPDVEERELHTRLNNYRQIPLPSSSSTVRMKTRWTKSTCHFYKNRCPVSNSVTK